VVIGQHDSDWFGYSLHGISPEARQRLPTFAYHRLAQKCASAKNNFFNKAIISYFSPPCERLFEPDFYE
jgi:hypothetical protein